MADELFKNLTPPVAAPEENELDKEVGNEAPTEMDLLKKRAMLMNISFSNNIGVDALKAKIQAAIDGKVQEPEVKIEEPVVLTTIMPETETNPLSGVQTRKGKVLSLRQHLVQEKMKLIRVRITNLDPKKKDLPGEIITVANEFLGTVRKYVPFGEVTDNGYHIPKCIYDMLKERTFVSIKTRRGTKGEQVVEYQNAREFALDILDPLTPSEIAQLAASQSAAGGL